jgi:hypothetical protein
MSNTTKTDDGRSQAKDKDRLSKAQQSSILMIGIVLLAVGALLPSREAFLAGAVCIGTAMLTRRIFG